MGAVGLATRRQGESGENQPNADGAKRSMMVDPFAKDSYPGDDPFEAVLEQPGSRTSRIAPELGIGEKTVRIV
ncbi:MAG: hypothetical protein H6Q03_2383 [Acidobacteria bacterium]|nr:hypothetical protein [Acidobacteriota bacterium]